jgi:hypothetical protein
MEKHPPGRPPLVFSFLFSFLAQALPSYKIPRLLYHEAGSTVTIIQQSYPCLRATYFLAFILHTRLACYPTTSHCAGVQTLGENLVNEECSAWFQ